MSDLKRLLQIPPYATIADICRTVNHVIKKLIPGYSNAAVDTDWNNLTTPGLFLNSASASNSPSLTATEYYCLTLAYANSSDVAQIAIPYDVADGLYVRNYYAGSWSIWTGSSGGGSGTVTDFSFTNANGFTGVVTNSTTIPNLTLDAAFLESVVAGTNITVDDTDPQNPIISATGGGGMTNPMTTTGDMIYSSDNSGTPARLAIGTTDYGILSIGGVPTWAQVYSVLTPQPFDWGKLYVGTMHMLSQ